MRDESVIDLFAGPGGWDLAAGALGLEPLGIEWDAAACATREAAGLRTLHADVSALDPQEFAPCGGLIGSPPCQAFSMAGKGAGRRALSVLGDAIERWAEGKPPSREQLDEACEDPRAHLVLEPLRWALALKPRWVALEQVEPVLPLWERIAWALRRVGYRTWTGVLSAERFGVPQTRRRAFMLASLDGPVAAPVATHQRYIPPRKREEATLGLFDAPEPERIVAPEDRELLPWVSMAEALGWGMTARPYPVIASACATGGPDKEKVGGSAAREVIYDKQAAGRWRFRANAQGNATERGVDEPAPTITGGHDFNERQWVVNTGRDWKKGGSREDAQSFNPVDAPAPTVTTKSDRWQVKPDEPQPDWPAERPATTVAGDPRVFPPGHKINEEDIAAGRGGQQRSGAGWTDSRPSTSVMNDDRIAPAGHHDNHKAAAVRVTLEEALVLQSFPPDYPVQGTKTKQFEQVGNAVPPGLAFAVLLAVLPAGVEAAS